MTEINHGDVIGQNGQPVLDIPPAITYMLADDRIEVVLPDETVVVDGHEVGTSRIGFGILATLASRADSLVSVAEIYRSVWGHDMSESSNAAGVHVSILRKSFGEELGDPTAGVIRTRPRFGYKAVSSLSDVTPDFDGSAYHLLGDGRVLVSPEEAALIVDGRLVDDIRPLELKIFSELAKRPNRVVGTDMLGLAVWGYTDRSVLDSARVHISNLRQRLGEELGDPRTGVLRTRRGIGYYAVSSLDR